MEHLVIIDPRPGAPYVGREGASQFVTGVTGQRGIHRRVVRMIVERIEAVERNANARDAAKHAETAFRRMGPSAALGERPTNRDLRRVEVMLVRRIVTG
jgi:hypothetical protein